MRSFVIGGAGFIGSHLVDRLVPRGPVTAYDNLSAGKRAFLDPHLATSAVTLIEALAWWRSFEALGVRPPFFRLVGTRIVAEAVMLGLPSGALISESLQPYLLKRRCGVPFETAVVATVGRKFFVVVSHGIVLAVATLLTWPLLTRVSRATIGRAGLPWLLLAVALFMIAAFGVGIALGARAGMAERTRAGLGRVPGRRLASWLERNATRFQRTDDHLLTFFQRERGSLGLPLVLYSAGWVVRGAEVQRLHRVGSAVVHETSGEIVAAHLTPELFPALIAGVRWRTGERLSSRLRCDLRSASRVRCSNPELKLARPELRRSACESAPSVALRIVQH